MLPYFPERDSTRDSYASVTRVINATQSESKRKSLQNWIARTGKEKAEKISEASRNRGSKFHDDVKQYWKGQRDGIHQSIKYFLENSGIEIEFCESWIYSDKYGYKGIVDMVAKYKGKGCIVEWKTSNKDKKSEQMGDAKLQVSAYANAVEEMYKIKIETALVIVAVERELVKEFNPFSIPEKYYTFQIFELNEKQINRSFTRFAKKVLDYKNPEYLDLREKMRKGKSTPTLAPSNPFSI